MKTFRRTPRKAAVDEPNKILTNLFAHLASDLGLKEEKTVLKAIHCLRNDQFSSFLDLASSWSEQQYGSAPEHGAWNQLSCIFKKYPFVDPRLNPESVGVEKFLAAEHKCKRVNARFKARRALKGRSAPYEQLLHRARRYIQSVIGVSPNYERIWSMCDFGPGASVGVHGTLTHSAKKLASDKWTVTPACVPFARAALKVNPLVWEHLSDRETLPYSVDPCLFDRWLDSKVLLVDANKITFVPKTAKTHRAIAIEPLLNGFVQKGVDNYLRGKLRRHNIDLRDRTMNQHFAKLGSEDVANPFATIDLSSASDTISLELVRELLPPDWFAFLNAIRSRFYILDGETRRFEKFSSMGNGFSFPLETLIFASVVHSAYAETGDLAFRVYGDDIIVRQSAALLTIEYLNYFGFKVNTDKTFIFGPFRESCGADYYRGENVRPYYIDEVPRNWGDIYKWMNGLYRKFGIGRSWDYLESLIPSYKRLYRPFDGPDDSITVPLDVFMTLSATRWNINEHRWSYKRLLAVPVSDEASYPPALQMYGVLRGLRSRGDAPDFTHRRKTRVRACLC